MSEITKEELTALLQTWKLSCEKDCEKECNVEFMEDECKPCFDALRSLVENMDKEPRVSKEFVEKWQQEIIACLNLGLSNYAWKDLLPTMFAELGLEVEEKEAADEPK